MSASDNDNVSLSELIQKVNMVNKNIKALTDLTKAIEEQFQAKTANNVDETERIDKMLRKRGWGDLLEILKQRGRTTVK